MKRRSVLSLTAGAAASATAIGGFAGTAAAWVNEKVEFKGCSEVWIILDDIDAKDTPPAPCAKVVFALPDGGLVCRDFHMLSENTTYIPGQHDDDPIIKVRAGDGEKILGVVLMNFQNEDLPEGDECDNDPVCVAKNDHTCALTPNTPAVEDAPCWADRASCEIVEGPGGGPGEKGKDAGSRGKGKGGKP